jgi:hypothetical protein
MLASAAPAAYTHLLAHDLGNEALHIVGPSKVVPMATMIAEQQISRTERCGDGDAGPFLADAGVHGAE